MKRYSQEGFTLIELLVVTAIVGLLSSIGVASVSEYRQRAYATHSMTNLKSGINDMEAYIMQENYLRDITGFKLINEDGTIERDNWEILSSATNVTINNQVYLRTTNCGLLHTDQYLVVAIHKFSDRRHSFIKSCDGRQGRFEIPKPVGEWYEENANSTPGHWPP